MNYYGYTSGYGMNPYAYSYGGCCNTMPYYSGGGYGFGYGAAIILVLFILLVVVFGAGFINGNER